MNDKLLIKLTKIIKQSKQPIIKAFEDDSSRVSYVNFNLADIKLSS